MTHLDAPPLTVCFFRCATRVLSLVDAFSMHPNATDAPTVANDRFNPEAGTRVILLIFPVGDASFVPGFVSSNPPTFCYQECRSATRSLSPGTKSASEALLDNNYKRSFGRELSHRAERVAERLQARSGRRACVQGPMRPPDALPRAG
jgi:hypothetical protein